MVKYDSDFKLSVEVIRDGKCVPCHFNVETVYSSDTVDKFRISGGGKIMEFEKHLFKKRFPWKITFINFQFAEIDDRTSRTLDYIWELIDERRYGKARINYRPPEQRHSH